MKCEATELDVGQLENLCVYWDSRVIKRDVGMETFFVNTLLLIKVNRNGNIEENE